MIENILNIMYEEAALWVPKMGGLFLILLVFFVLSKVVKSIIKKVCFRLSLDKHLCLLLARTSSVTLIIVGMVTALGTMGVDVSAIVAGLGLTGFALGFALKDIVSNLLSGVLILLYRPFSIGNTIKVSGYEGEVVKIDLRYTELISEGNKMLMPNSKLFTDPITVVEKNDSSNQDQKAQIEEK